MQEDDTEGVARLLEESDALERVARAAARAPAEPGSDGTGSVTVTLDERGLVATVTVDAGWRQRVPRDRLGDAVIEAVSDASARRLAAWGAAFDEGSDDPVDDLPRETGHGPVAGGVAWDRGDFQRRLQEVATAPMSEADRLAALTGLLDLVQDIERGIDEVSGKLGAAVDATYTGRSPDRHVVATVTGAGEVTAIRIDRPWANEAHEINIGRQVASALRAAYDQVAARGVHTLIAESSLGSVQRAVQDPLGLARRLRLSE